jgi:AraC family transcriptional regulator of adaptative response / DNA-3-methyladenine glycosylase II
MRSHARSKVEGTSTTLRVRLPFRQPLCPDNLFGHLIATAVPGVEEFRDGAYRRTVHLPHGPGVVALTPKPDHIACDLALSDLRDLATAISRCRRLLDLDADPAAVDELLSSDEVLAPLVAKSPGRRVPRTIDAEEMALRAVIGQQISTAAARTQAARLVVAAGTPIADPGGGLTHLFPTPAQVLDADPECLGMPAARRRAVLGLAAALDEGAISMDPGCDRADTRARLTALPGLGPWTVETVAMRALGDPDAFLSGDLGIRRAAEFLGLPARPAPLEARSEAWRPWRAYAAQYLWSVLDHPINRLPSPRSEAVAHRGGT